MLSRTCTSFADCSDNLYFSNSSKTIKGYLGGIIVKVDGFFVAPGFFVAAGLGCGIEDGKGMCGPPEHQQGRSPKMKRKCSYVYYPPYCGDCNKRPSNGISGRVVSGTDICG